MQGRKANGTPNVLDERVEQYGDSPSYDMMHDVYCMPADLQVCTCYIIVVSGLLAS